MKTVIFLPLLFLICHVAVFGQNNSRANPVKPSADPNMILFMDYSETVDNCLGEPIDFTGTIVLMSHHSPTGKDPAKLNVNYLGVFGINQVTGDRYHLIAQESVIFRTFLGHFYVATSVEKLLLIGQSTGRELEIRYLKHITVHGDGSWDIVVEKRSVRCD